MEGYTMLFKTLSKRLLIQFSWLKYPCATKSCTNVTKGRLGPGAALPTCNPSYSGGRFRRTEAGGQLDKNSARLRLDSSYLRG
jgi:hypothetical protein